MIIYRKLPFFKKKGIKRR